MNENKIEKVFHFYLLATSLKELIRSGWKKWHVEKERLESVAEHIYGTCMLAIAVDSEFELSINLEKCILMLVIHELEEVKIGDLTPFDKIEQEEKRRIGKEAVNMVLKDLSKKDEYLSMIEEFEQMQTKEAIFCKMCDKLETDLQSEIYCESGNVNLKDPRNQEVMRDERVIGMIQKGAKTLSDFFVENDRKVFQTKEFEEMADYIRQHDNLLKLKGEE